ncbi:SpoIIE family protein phosphatase [Streptomyces sp. NPDC001156]
MQRLTAPGSVSGWADLDGLLRRLVQDAGPSGGMLFLLPPGEQVLQLAMVYGSSWHIVAPWARIGVDEAIPAAEAARERRLVWVGSPEELATHYPRLRFVVPHDHVVAAAPIITGDAVWGTACLLWPAWHPPRLGPDEREALDVFCRQAGPLLQRAAARSCPLLPTAEPRVLEPVRSCIPDRAEALAAHAFAARLPGALSMDLDGRITYLSEAAADLLGDGVASGLLGVRPWEHLRWLSDPTFEDRFRAAVISRRPTAFTALRPPDRRLSFHLYPDAFGVSIDIAPLPHDPATAPETSTQPPAGPAGAAALYHLMHLAATLTETVGVKDVADRVADQLVPGFGAQGLALMTVDDGRLRIASHRGYSRAFAARFDGESLTSHTPRVRALTTGTPIFFSSFAEFQRAYPGAVRYGDRNAWAFLPLITSSRPIGLLFLSYDRPRHFPPAERTILISLTGLIAQALDRARLYDAKHTLACTLQKGLLPQKLPRIPGLQVAARYLAADQGMDIGGDFYDLIRGDDTNAYAVIGDVQGHDVQAAALMGQLRTAVHAHAAVGMEPGALMTSTNRLLCDLNPGLFASCMYAHLDLTRHCARLAVAGHPPPLLRHPGGRTETLMLQPGPLLGITPDADYPTADIPLPSGTTLAMYTDGLVEAPGIDIDHAIAGLADQLARARDGDSMETLIEALLHRAAQTITPTDDIALLLIHTTT